MRTRIQLLKAAHALMSNKGVDDTTIIEITERADIGFGTFYNYFSSKDDIATAVLDCVINTLGKRNDMAASRVKHLDPCLTIANSVRAVAREMMDDKMWRWWLKRPDLMVDRMRAGFYVFAIRDIDRAIEAGSVRITDKESAWSILIWTLAGRIKDIAEGIHPRESESEMTNAILRMLGVDFDRAAELSALPLPPLPAAEIDFSFVLAPDPLQKENAAA